MCRNRVWIGHYGSKSVSDPSEIQTDRLEVQGSISLVHIQYSSPILTIEGIHEPLENCALWCQYLLHLFIWFNEQKRQYVSKVHSHYAFACAFASTWNYGFLANKLFHSHLRLCLCLTLHLTHWMGSIPIFDICVCIKLHRENRYQVNSAAC